jgi:siderophore synthetase component
VLAIALCVGAGCSRKASPPTATDSSSTNAVIEAVAPVDAAKQGLTRLCDDESAYIKNNARQALASWESRDYQSAVIALQKVVSLCRSASQQEAAMSSLAPLQQEIKTAAAKGDANAKEAAATLAQWFSSQQ